MDTKQCILFCSSILAMDTKLCSVLFQYIGYARKYVHPKIGPEAAKVLQVARIFSQ